MSPVHCCRPWWVTWVPGIKWLPVDQLIICLEHKSPSVKKAPAATGEGGAIDAHHLSEDTISTCISLPFHGVDLWEEQNGVQFTNSYVL